MTIFNNDDVAGTVNGNADATSTGQSQQTVGNNQVNVDVQGGEVTLTGALQFDQFSPIYEGNDNIQPIISVETKFPIEPGPNGSLATSFTATLNFVGYNESSTATFNVPNQITSATQTMRFVILGPAGLDTVLASGHYEWDIVFKANFLDGAEKNRTIFGSTELVNRVSSTLGETMFGQRWWIPGLDELVPSDGEASPSDPSSKINQGLAASRAWP